MSRPIDADALKTKKRYSAEFHENVVAVAEIDWMPTIDAVQVVRCGECYYKDEKRIMDEDALWCRKHHMYVTADWFCADGERKEKTNAPD